MSQIRIATIKKNGRKYIVNCIEFPRQLIFVFGEVSKHINDQTFHEKGFSVPLDEVDITKVTKTSYLAAELFDQYIQSGVEDGVFKIVSKSGRKNRVVKTAYL